jgi:serine/threonine-protein kinase
MTDRADTTGQEPPIEAEEVVLAEFLDEAVDGLAGGQPVEVARLLRRSPDLIEAGQRLLGDVRAVLGAAAVLRDHALLLRSDVLCQAPGPPAGAEVRGKPGAEDLPDPFPGEFRIRKRLGTGAFGTVWLAEDLALGRPVALKTVRPPDQPERAARWLQLLRSEARLLAAVRHRNVVQVYSWRETAGGACYLVLQYLPGGSLADRVQQEGPLPWALAARYVADVAEGLLELHARGIVHRDVKPANILWDPEADEAVLTDLGVSVRLAEGGPVGGTPFYMPPEALHGTVSPAQDVYALAVSLFWLVTGSVPFPGRTREEIVAQARRGLPQPEARCAGLPAALERLLRAALDADPDRRAPLAEFSTALRGDLNRLLADSLLASPQEASASPSPVRLAVYRQTDRHTLVPVAATHPPQERFLRDLRRVPREPARVTVQTGERLRIEAELDRPGFLTVFNIGPTGNLNVLFPEVSGGVLQPVWVTAAGPQHILDVVLTLPAGPERLFALWSREPLPLRMDELNDVARGGSLPSGDAYRATRDMKRIEKAVQQLGPDDYGVSVLDLCHLPAPEGMP